MKMFIVSSFMRFVFGDYKIYWIYESDRSKKTPFDMPGLTLNPIKKLQDIKLSPYQEIRDTAIYWGSGSYGFGAWENLDLISVCWFWYGQRYASRNFWPLQSDQAKLVQVVTAGDFRGRGIAASLIQYSREEMWKNNFKKLYARIWHNNNASMRTFKKCGWRRIKLVIDIYPFKFQRRIRFCFPAKES